MLVARGSLVGFGGPSIIAGGGESVKSWAAWGRRLGGGTVNGELGKFPSVTHNPAAQRVGGAELLACEAGASHGSDAFHGEILVHQRRGGRADGAQVGGVGGGD